MAGFFKKVGAFFGKVGKVILPIVGAVAGVGAIGGIVKGVGALKGIGGILAGGKKVIDVVGAKAAELVSGATKTEREQIAVVKDRVKAAQDKLDQVARLIKAGASEAEARSTVGLSANEFAAVKAEVVNAGYTEVTPGEVVSKAGFLSGIIDMIKANPVVAVVGIGLLVFVLPGLLKKRR